MRPAPASKKATPAKKVAPVKKAALGKAALGKAALGKAALGKGAGRARREAGPREPARSPRTRLDVDERRAQLVALGLEQFSARPYDEVSIDEIAAAAGISKGLLYHYFPTKRDFYAAAIREASRRLLDTTFTPDSVPPLERLRAGLEAYLAYVEQHGAAYSALFRGGIGSDTKVAFLIEETRQRFLERLLEGVPVAVPAPLLRATLRGWIGFVEAASLDWLEHKDLSRRALGDLLAGMLPQAIQAALQLASGG
jgi:AcrR family transcriptional regulator